MDSYNRTCPVSFGSFLDYYKILADINAGILFLVRKRCVYMCVCARMCVCVCVWVCMRACMCTSMFACIFVCVRSRTLYVCVLVCLCVSAHVCIHLHMCVCLHSVVLRLASYAADGGPRKAIFYARSTCANVLNTVNIFCRTAEYCENCVSYFDLLSPNRGRDASDRYVRRGDKVLDQLRCFQVHDTYTSGGGVVFANVTVPEFNKTSSALYCLVFYDIAKRQGIVGVPLLKYGERSSEPSTMPPGDKKKNSSSAAVSLVPFSVAFLLSALSLLTQI